MFSIDLFTNRRTYLEHGGGEHHRHRRTTRSIAALAHLGDHLFVRGPERARPRRVLRGERVTARTVASPKGRTRKGASEFVTTLEGYASI